MDHLNAPTGSSDLDYWKTILSILLGSGLTVFGQWMTNRHQIKMEKSKWEREDKINEVNRGKESDSAVLMSMYPNLLEVYLEALKLRPGVGGDLFGNIHVNDAPITPSESFMSMAQGLIEADPSVLFVDDEIGSQSRKLIASLQTFVITTLNLANQRATGTPGTIMMETISRQTENLNLFLNECSSFFKLASQKIGFHRFGLPIDIQKRESAG